MTDARVEDSGEYECQVAHHGDMEDEMAMIFSVQVLGERFCDSFTVLVLRMAHRIWKETKQQPGLLPGPAVPGCCLVSFQFLWAILCPMLCQTTMVTRTRPVSTVSAIVKTKLERMLLYNFNFTVTVIRSSDSLSPLVSIQ